MAYIALFAVIATLASCGYSHGESVVMPPGCEDSDYCTIRPEGYDKYYNNMDKVIQTSKYWAGIDSGDIYKDLEPVYSIDGVNCDSVQEVVTPFIIKALVNTTSSDNKLVVQTELFKQKIQTTKCYNKMEASCLDALVATQGDIATHCDERYSTITLYVFDDNKIVPLPFTIPVFCACVIEHKNVDI